MDEQLHPDVAEALTVLRRSKEDRFDHIAALGAAGTEDLDIPSLCSGHGITCVISANVKDFGALKTVYVELLDAGVHVVVLRFGKAKPTPEVQMQVLATCVNRVDAILDAANEPTLVRVSPSGECAVRTIQELILEITGGESPLP